MNINIPNTVPSKPLPQASSSDDNNAPWEHDTTRQERDHVIIDEKLDTELDLGKRQIIPRLANNRL